MFTTKLSSGFSYVEIFFVLLIIVMLSLTMLPAYRDVLLKTRRAEARSALHTVMLQQERFYTQHNTYSAFTPDTKNSLFKWWSGHSPVNSYYEISATNCSGQLLTQCVLLTARPVKSKLLQIDDPVCGNLMLDSANNKTYSHGSEPEPLCW
jgi:type IV pilus assembly protein PilE